MVLSTGAGQAQSIWSEKFPYAIRVGDPHSTEILRVETYASLVSRMIVVSPLSNIALTMGRRCFISMYITPLLLMRLDEAQEAEATWKVRKSWHFRAGHFVHREYLTFT